MTLEPNAFQSRPRAQLTPAQYDRVRELFLAVYDRDPTQRAATLDTEDPTRELRAEVDALLEQHDDLTEFLAPADLTTLASQTDSHGWPWAPRPGDRIGPYVVRRLLGEGGFGMVCEAEQTQPVRRRVAIKILKNGLDTREIITRFEVERQALALMEHRFIAKVLDAGTTPGGRPYFVMEYVPGVPITKFCEQHRLDINARLGLFLQLCEGVQHAHQKGVIHRDIKPSNVLVATQGERTVPKIIDFGIAKATGPILGDNTTVTLQGQLVGTPAYMSPEQADVDSPDVDTRADIYSLGALLYEMLVGAPPFDPETLRGRGLAEIRRLLRDKEPMQPSSRVALLAAKGELAGTSAAAARALQRQLRGDLDWVVLKAMEKDRGRRYPTAFEFAADIKRHMAYQPVVAGPPSRLYRLSKFVRRNRVGVAASIVVLVAVTAGLTGMAWQRARAQNEARLAGNVIQMLGDIFGAAAAGTNPADRVDPDHLDAVAAELLGNVFANQPEVHGKLLGSIAFMYRTVGRPADAVKTWERSLSLRSAALGAEHPETLVTMNYLAEVLLQQGEWTRAEMFSRRAHEASLRTLGEDNRITLKATVALGTVLRQRGVYTEAEQLLRSARSAQERILGPEHADTVKSTDQLANLLSMSGRHSEAVGLMRFVVKVQRRTQGPASMRALGALQKLADMSVVAGQYDDAARALGELLAARTQRLGADDEKTLATRLDLEEVKRLATGKPVEASLQRAETGHPIEGGAIKGTEGGQR